MKTLKKIGKFIIAIAMFFAGLLLILSASCVFVVLLSKVFTNTFGLNEPGKVLVAIVLTAIVLGILAKPFKWLVNKWLLLFNYS